LSSESNFNNYRGLFNLAAIVLVVGNFRLVLENLLHYGILIHKYPLTDYVDLPLLFCSLVGLNAFIIVTLTIEQLSARKKIPNLATAFLQTINSSCCLCGPLGAVLYLKPPAVSGMILAGMACTTWMKLVSYILVNREARIMYRQGKSTYEREISSTLKDHVVEFPNNLTLKNLYYFMVAPTLVYQFNYPRSAKIRWIWLSFKVAQFIFCFLVILFMVIQHIIPSIHSSVSSIREGRVGHALERILKLAIPSMVIWLIGFYTFFHLTLNIVGELLRFGDREFYRDWWNSTTLAEYWRKWNMPVHNWLVRHVYYPYLKYKVSRITGSFVIFLISAVFHEILISVPLRSFNLWFFFGMMVQIPLIIFSERFTVGSLYGNLLFWMSFCILGQPILLLLYYQDYYDMLKQTV